MKFEFNSEEMFQTVEGRTDAGVIGNLVYY